MKKRIVLTSVMAVALCLCVIAGSSLAIFTSMTRVDVSVSAGYIDFTAFLDPALIVWSRLETEADSTDEFFANGGTAVVNKDGVLTIERMTPGDNVKATIHISNKSNVAVKYRVVMTAENGDSNVDLVGAIVGMISISDDLGEYRSYPIQGSETEWYDIPAHTNLQDMYLTLTLPDSVGNELMGAEADFYITVEAIQWDGMAWDGSVDTAWYDSDPTASSFSIGTAAELAGLSQIVNTGVDTFADNTVTLTNDINLDGSLWTPIGNESLNNNSKFAGTFDGAGYTVRNMTVNTEIGAGLFGFAFDEGAGATIRNVRIDKADITALSKAGAVVGHLYGSVYNCTVTNSTITCIDPNAQDGDKVGSIVGYSSPETVVNINDCTAKNVKITANRDAGCIVGFGMSTMSLDGTKFVNVTVTHSGYGTGANIVTDEALGRKA